jgi:iduronate 2-sulfatase
MITTMKSESGIRARQLMTFLLALLHVATVLAVVPLSAGHPQSRPPKHNVLLIMADDMRPEIGAFYDPLRPYSMNPRMHTPSLNALAAGSLVLRRAYVQQAICAPSRVSLLTSRRPDTTRVYTITKEYWRHLAGDLVTLPQFFKERGYSSIGIGKIFHHGPGSNQVSVSTVRYRSCMAF